MEGGGDLAVPSLQVRALLFTFFVDEKGAYALHAPLPIRACYKLHILDSVVRVAWLLRLWNRSISKHKIYRYCLEFLYVEWTEWGGGVPWNRQLKSIFIVSFHCMIWTNSISEHI